MKFGFLLAVLSCFGSGSALALENDNCTAAKKFAVCNESVVKEKVDWACNLVKSKGKEALPEISSMRYECCGEPDYVWINDLEPKMIMHPIKTAMDGKDLKNEKDPNGKKLFVEFAKSVKKAPDGGWVEYQWTRFGDPTPTPKKSWVKKCKVGATSEEWVVGSGTWMP